MIEKLEKDMIDSLKNKEKERLTKIIDELLPKNFGVIVRTSAMKKNKE